MHERRRPPQSGGRARPSLSGRRAFRRMLVCVLVAVCLGSACRLPVVQAHLTGAFSTYLAAVYNEDTTRQLKEELERTRQEIDEMTPRLDGLERRFAANRDEAGARMLEWYNGGLDVWAALLQSGETVTDVLANQWLVSRQLDRELERLQQLYVEYLQVGMTRDALAGHERLLHVIEANLAMRRPYLDSMGDIDLETQAYYLDIDWTAEVEKELIAALEADRDLAAAQWTDWLSVSETDGRTQLTESWLNERSTLEYHFRSDHIYAVFANDFANVILVAQMTRNERQEAQFVIEGAFFNGFMVPESALQELADKTLRLSYDKLRAATGSAADAYLEQADGRLVWATGN